MNTPEHTMYVLSIGVVQAAAISLLLKTVDINIPAKIKNTTELLYDF